MTSKACLAAAFLLVGALPACDANDGAATDDDATHDAQSQADGDPDAAVQAGKADASRPGSSQDAAAQLDSTTPSGRDAAAPTREDAATMDAKTQTDARPVDAAPQADGKTTDAAEDAASSGSTTECDAPALVWKSGNKTNYESYPDPGSDECVRFNGCAYKGQFQSCNNTMPESWVKAHNIAAVFPLAGLAMHRLCVRAGGKTIIVTAIDTCGDSDCSGCCTENRGSADALIDLEKYTNQRFGVQDGKVQWADLGAGDQGFDGCN